MDKFKYLLQSRKFWAAFVGLIFVIITAYVPNFPIAEEVVLEFVLVIVAYILGTGLEDGLSARALADKQQSPEIPE